MLRIIYLCALILPGIFCRSREDTRRVFDYCAAENNGDLKPISSAVTVEWGLCRGACAHKSPYTRVYYIYVMCLKLDIAYTYVGSFVLCLITFVYKLL